MVLRPERDRDASSPLRTRSVYLKVSHSFSTDSFIMVLLRLVLRIDALSEIFSDNETKFVGAKRELQNLIGNWTTGKIPVTPAINGDDSGENKKLSWQETPVRQWRRS